MDLRDEFISLVSSGIKQGRANDNGTIIGFTQSVF